MADNETNGNSEKQAIELAKDQTKLAPTFGARAELREFVERFRAGMPGAETAPDRGLLSLATFCLAHGLDPWNGEAWLCINRDRTTGVIKDMWVQAGIKGRRKAARNQMPPGELFYTDFHLARPEEIAGFGVDPKDILLAYICEIRRTDLNREYYANLQLMIDATGDAKTAIQIVGPPPRYVGVGIVRTTNKSKMEPVQLAKKRAEDDALKQGWDLPLTREMTDETAAVGAGWSQDEIVEGKAVLSEYGVTNGDELDYGLLRDPWLPDTSTLSAEELREKAARGSESLYGDKGFEGFGDAPRAIPARPYAPEAFRGAFAGAVAHANLEGPASDKQIQYLASLMSVAFKDSPTKAKDRYTVLGWLTGRKIKTTKDLSAAEASTLINLLTDDTGDLGADGAQEMIRLRDAAAVAEGQLELPIDE